MSGWKTGSVVISISVQLGLARLSLAKTDFEKLLSYCNFCLWKGYFEKNFGGEILNKTLVENIQLGNTLDFNQSFRFSPPLPNGDRLQRRRSCQNLLGQYDLREGGSQKSLMLYQDCVHQVKLTKRVKFCLFYTSPVVVVGGGGFCDFIANLSPAKLGLRLSLAIWLIEDWRVKRVKMCKTLKYDWSPLHHPHPPPLYWTALKVFIGFTKCRPFQTILFLDK